MIGKILVVIVADGCLGSAQGQTLAVIYYTEHCRNSK